MLRIGYYGNQLFCSSKNGQMSGCKASRSILSLLSYYHRNRKSRSFGSRGMMIHSPQAVFRNEPFLQRALGSGYPESLELETAIQGGE